MARSITDRMVGAATLDVATYEEVEADTTATGQAAIVVVVAAICAGIGSIRHGGGGIVGGVVGSLIGWLLWSGITYVVGTKLFGGTATWGELLRTLGFAQAPQVLLILAILPIVGGLVRVAVAIWVLVAGIIAIRQALDFTTGKAIMTAVVGWLALMIVMMLFGGMGWLMFGR